MSFQRPEFSTGNKSFVKALNTVVDFVFRKGVNPAGRPGWSYSKDGWVPPPAGIFSSQESPWDLRPGTAEDTWSVTTGRIGTGDGIHNTSLTHSNPLSEWELSEGSILAIKLASVTPSSYTIEHYSDWPITSDKYVEVSGSSFSYRLFPLWHISATDSPAFSVPIGEDLFAIRLVPPSHFSLAYTWHVLPSNALIITPDLVPYFGPVI